MTSVIGVYASRSCSAYCKLDRKVFGVLNREGFDALALVGGGCLDAPDQIPAGSVRAYGRKERLVLPNIVQRTQEDATELSRREEITKRLIDEILAEEAMKNSVEVGS